MPRRGAALLAAAAAAATAAAWDPAIEAYRAQLIAFTKDDVKGWATKTRAARAWMAANDPDYPLYHLTAPEGWNNDPNVRALPAEPPLCLCTSAFCKMSSVCLIAGVRAPSPG